MCGTVQMCEPGKWDHVCVQHFVTGMSSFTFHARSLNSALILSFTTGVYIVMVLQVVLGSSYGLIRLGLGYNLWSCRLSWVQVMFLRVRLGMVSILIFARVQVWCGVLFPTRAGR